MTERKKIEPNLYVTRLRITLDQEGSVHGIQVLNSSGLLELDEAPKKALWETEPFPNPPSQLIESDGFVRLTYEFQFEWKNSVFNIIPWKI
jgi:TonB family protein